MTTAEESDKRVRAERARETGVVRYSLVQEVAEPGLEALSRFECDRPNDMWIGDTLHGPLAGGKKAYLFALVDDHSRAIMGARWAYSDDVVRMAAAFRPALQARGVPRKAYFDYA